MDEPRLYRFALGKKTDEFLRQQSINAAVVGFLVHLVLCVLYGFGRIDLPGMKPLIDSYLDALYTPFSIILAYEVYELIRAIPESFSNAIGKQFEVVTLLVVRDIFKNLADLNETESTSLYDPVAFIAVEVVAFIVLFATALYFRKNHVEFCPHDAYRSCAFRLCAAETNACNGPLFGVRSGGALVLYDMDQRRHRR